MSIEHLTALMFVIAIATYIQTVTGFGLGMIVMGATSGLELAPVPVVAAVVSLITLVNSAVALPGRMHLVDWRAARAVLLGVIPSIVAGVLLLNYLNSAASIILKLLLGAVITYSGVVFALRPTQHAERSPDRGFFVCGLFSGLFGGLFGMAGPPAIFHFYRQPMDLAVVRHMLLLVFAFTSATRTVYLGINGELTREIWILAAIAALLVALATAAGRHYPPPLAQVTMRRIAFGILILIGAGLVVSALSELAF
ncbi:MAG: hypothetical protein C0607_13880 [Azoarcus sp.]|nr:MAG: hypothetical protein C0607_13880 [Azoarcus sp.]